MNKKLLLKTMFLLCALITGSTNAWAADPDETVNFSEQGYINQQEITSYTGTDFTITFNKGTNSNAPKYYTSGTAIRAYGGNTITITSTTKTFTKIVIGFGSSDGSNAITTDHETYSNGTWTGSQSSVVFTIGGTSGNRRIASVAVTYEVSDGRSSVNVTGLTFSPTSLVVGSGETSQATATHDTPSCTSATFTYESLNPEIATCTTAGVITPVAKGTATIKATLSIPNEDANYRVGTGTITENIIISNPSHKVSFYVNGNKLSETDVEEDNAIVFPSDPTAIGGKEFVGWIKEEIEGNTDIAPSEFFSAATMSDEDINFYAVFGKVLSLTSESWSETSFASITVSDVFVIAATDSEWTYAMTNNNGTSTAPAAVEITVSDNKISSTVNDNYKWNVKGNATDGYTFYPDGVTTSWLYCNTTAASSSNNNIRVGTGVRKLWEFDGNGYLVTKDENVDRYLSMYNNADFRGYINTSNGAFVPKFFKYIAPSKICEGYCTTVTSPIAITSAKYATYCSEYALDFTGKDVKAYTAKMDEGVVKLSQINVVPANTGVILYAESADTYVIPVTTTDAVVSNNQLVGITTEKTVAWNTDGTYNYILQSNSAGGVVFNKATETGAKLRANRAYLALDSAPAAPSLQIVFDNGMTTGISEAVKVNSEKLANAPVYNLSGQRVVQPTKGLYIVNGKKTVIK